MPDEEILDVSDAELSMLKRIREGKVDPKTIAEAKPEPDKTSTRGAGGDGEGKPRADPDPGVNVEERVAKAVEKATGEVKLKATRDQEGRENVAAADDVVNSDPTFAKWAADDKNVYGDVRQRVSERLKDPDSLEKIKAMDRPAYLEHIAALTGDVLKTMKESLGVKEPDNTDLDTRLKAASTGVGGSGGRRGGSGTEKDVETPPDLSFGKMDRTEEFPSQIEIEKRHDKRMAAFVKKEGV